MSTEFPVDLRHQAARDLVRAATVRMMSACVGADSRSPFATAVVYEAAGRLRDAIDYLSALEAEMQAQVDIQVGPP